jgi:cyclic beta-1,2-glucan synthetase
MAHHQGMSIVALANVLLGGVARRWGMATPTSRRWPRCCTSARRARCRACTRPPPGRRRSGASAARRRLLREVLPGAGALEPTHLLSNGRYSVALRANGAGWSRWGTSGLTRWRDDALRDACGSFFYLRWDGSRPGCRSPSTRRPMRHGQYRSVFHADRVCFDASWPTCTRAPRCGSARRTTSSSARSSCATSANAALEIELMSAFEVTLAEARADEAHPAFSQPVRARAWQPAQQALLFERTPRLASEAGAARLAHFLAESRPAGAGLRCQTDRQRWRGRNRGSGPPAHAAAAHRVLAAGRAGHRAGPGLRAGGAAAHGAGAQGRLTFATAASDDAGTLHAVIDKYRQASHVQRASLMSATLAGIRCARLRIGAEDLAGRPDADHGAGAEPDPTAGPGAAAAKRARRVRPAPAVALRPLGRPAAAAGVGRRPAGSGPAAHAGAGAALWAWGGVACDLVVLNAEPASYLMACSTRWAHCATATTPTPPACADPPLHRLFVLRADDLSVDETATLQAPGPGAPARRRPAAGAPRAGLDRPHEQVHFDTRQDTSTTAVPVATTPRRRPPRRRRLRRRERRRSLRGRPPAAPGAAVDQRAGQPGFGSQVSEAGGGFTWAVNSRLNQLTAWSNDPVADPPSEWFLLQDLRTRQAWSAGAVGLGRR